MRVLRLILITLVVLVGVFWAYSFFTMRDSGPHAYAPVTEEQKAEAQAYLDASLKPMPAGWAWEDFEAEHGVTLRTGRVSTPGAADTVLIIPGYTAMVELYSESAQNFVDAGFNVAALDYRGQGLSPRDLDNPEKGHVESYPRLTADIAAYIAKLKDDGAGRIFVYANSMGGHLALRMAGTDKPDVAAYFLLVPMVKIETGGFPYGVARTLATFYSHSGLAEAFVIGRGPFVPGKPPLGTASECMRNPAKAQRRDALFILDERYRVTGNTNEWVWRTMNSTDLISDPEFLKGIDKPFFTVTAGVDRWVNSSAAQATCNALGTCEQKHFPDARHCIIEDDDETAAAIYELAISFFKANAK